MFFVPLRSFHCWKKSLEYDIILYTATATPVIAETEADSGNNARAVHFLGSPFTFRPLSEGQCRGDTQPVIKILSRMFGLVRDVN